MKSALLVKPALLGAALAAIATAPLTFGLAAHADDSITYDNTNFSAPDTASNADYPYEGRTGFVVSGSIRRVDGGNSRFTVFGDDGRRYNIDDYDASIRLNGQSADSNDLHEGMRVLVSGRLLGVAFVEANQVRVLPSADDSLAPFPAAPMQIPAALPTPAVPIAPLVEASPSAVPVPAAPAVDGTPVTMDAVVTGADPDGRHVSLLDAHDNRLTADTLGSDIILPEADHAGQFADLIRGLHVHLIGTQAADGSIQADRIRVVPADEQSAPIALPADAVPVDPAPAPSVPVDVDLSQYTGILIDARGLPGIERSPAPDIIGPDGALLYPDRSHVPTPDEVQDESIVRYYHTLEDAEQGVAGAHPLILSAAALIGPASDSVQLSDSDAALLQQLDKRLRFSRTWKVGFLIPSNQ